jgi:hypothetical protein
MTNREIAQSFVRDVNLVDEDQFGELIRLSNDDHFADEAGDEFLMAVASVGLQRIML